MASGGGYGDEMRKKSSLASAGSIDVPRRGPSTKLDEEIPAEGSRFTFSHKAAMRENKGADIAKRYRIDAREFSSGGNGKVFIGQDHQYGDRRVAIKKVMIGSAEKQSTIRKEMEIMKTLDHPCICKLLETYEEGKNLYFVMELCEGGELFDRIADDGNVTEFVAADVINQVAGALNYAHGMGIAHRDLKPENICLVNRDPSSNDIKVIDWGLGFFFGGTSRMKSAVGSLAYAAPEVLEAEEESPYTSACDLWSLGAMAYVMLSGRPPFWGSVASQLKKMKNENFPMKDPPWQTISDDAKDFITCLLRANPANRLLIGDCMEHRWLKTFRDRSSTVSNETLSSVLWNMEKSSNNSRFLSVCLASAARQMDVKNYRDIREVFEKLDANHDGTIDLEEMRNGLVQIYGMDSQQAQNVSRIFMQLDLDENGKIDYTEFCAAALSEKMLEQEHILWMAFKAFDVHNDDGKITKEEIKEVLSKAYVRDAWSPQVCDAVAAEVLQTFDKENKGYMDFEAWLTMMRTVAWPEDQCPSSQALPPLSGDSQSSKSNVAKVIRRAMSNHSLGHKVCWVSLDPRTGQVCAYPKEISTIIDMFFQMGKESCDLGSKFFNARIVFSGTKTGQPFQRTPNGLRDVRRLEVVPGNDEIETWITGPAGEYRLASSPDGSRKQMTSGASANAIDPGEVMQLIEDQQKLRAQQDPKQRASVGRSTSIFSGLWGSSEGSSKHTNKTDG